MTRAYLRALQAVAVIGLFLAVLGFLGENGYRVFQVTTGRVVFRGGTGPLEVTLYCLEGAKIAGEPLLLAAILAVTCEIALRLVPRTTGPNDSRADEHDHPDRHPQ